MISIIDYGMGNIRSVQNALEYLHMPYRVTFTAKDILSSKGIILPGVGSFTMAMKNITSRGIRKPLNEAVVKRNIPLLGLCLGMQLLATKGYEGGVTDGLGFIDGDVRLMNVRLPLPHVGFNTVRIIHHAKPGDLYAGLGAEADFYFVHSYELRCKHAEDVSGYTEYGREFVSSVHRGIISGVQFHPEKSQSNGIKVLKNFIRLL